MLQKDKVVKMPSYYNPRTDDKIPILTKIAIGLGVIGLIAMILTFH